MRKVLSISSSSSAVIVLPGGQGRDRNPIERFKTDLKGLGSASSEFKISVLKLGLILVREPENKKEIWGIVSDPKFTDTLKDALGAANSELQKIAWGLLGNLANNNLNISAQISLFLKEQIFTDCVSSEECEKKERQSLLIYKLIQGIQSKDELKLFKFAIKGVAWPKAVIDKLFEMDTCLVCLDDNDSEKSILVDPKLMNLFSYHTECINPWLQTGLTDPATRAPIIGTLAKSDFVYPDRLSSILNSLNIDWERVLYNVCFFATVGACMFYQYLINAEFELLQNQKKDEP